MYPSFNSMDQIFLDCNQKYSDLYEFIFKNNNLWFVEIKMLQYLIVLYI